MEQITYALIMRINGFCYSVEEKKMCHQCERFSSTEMVYMMQVMKEFFLN